MDNKAYTLYASEAASWLHRGRRALIKKILQCYAPTTKQLEILEVGAGVGQNVQTLLEFGEVDVLEINPQGLSMLRKMGGVRSIFDSPIPCSINNTYNVIGVFDVIEHLENDREAVKWCFDQLKPGGLFMATVPAYMWLFSDHDRVLGHYRRYTAQSFLRLLPENSQVLVCSYFNMLLFPLAIFARAMWQFRQGILGRQQRQKQSIPKHGLLNQLLFKIMIMEIEWLIKPIRSFPFGLSIVVCVRKI